jgi:hypothetical protein
VNAAAFEKSKPSNEMAERAETQSNKTSARALKWRGWTKRGTSLGVCEAVNIEEATQKLRAKFGDEIAEVTTAYRGAETTA